MAYIQMALPLPKPGLHRSISIAGGNLGVCTDLSQQAAYHLGQEAAHHLGQEATHQGVSLSQAALGGLKPRVRGSLRQLVRCEFLVFPLNKSKAG